MRNQVIKKTLAFMLAMIMSVSLLSACGKSEEESKNSDVTEQSSEVVQSSESVTAESEATSVTDEEEFEHDPVLAELGTEPFCKEEVTITIALKQNANIEDYDTNHLTLLLEEASGVNIEFMLIPAGDADQKLQMMVAGGQELPDIILWGISDALAQQWGAEGYIVPLEEYFEHSSYYAKEAYAKVEEMNGLDVVKYQTLSDGHVWQFAAYQDSPSTPPGDGKMWVYRPWLEALNLEKPTTTEELKEMLIAFKTQDPNGNGKADEIPLIGSEIGKGSYGSTFWKYFMNAFVQTTSAKHYLISNDGQLSVSYTQDAWKEGIKYVHSLVEEGLIDPVTFTQNKDSFVSVVNSAGDQIVGAFAYTSPSFVNADHPSKQQWELLEPLTGPDGVCSTQWNVALPTNKAIITADCDHPEVAFRLLDLMCREDIGITNRWGKQGENWDYVENLKDDPAYKDVDFSQSFGGYPAYFYEIKNVWNQVQNNQWQQAGPYVNTADVVAGWYATSMDPVTNNQNSELGQHLGAYEAVKPAEPITKITYSSADEQTEAELIVNELKAYVHEMVANWLMGTSDVEADWDAYLAELENLGLSTWLDIQQKGWNN